MEIGGRTKGWVMAAMLDIRQGQVEEGVVGLIMSGDVNHQ